MSMPLRSLVVFSSLTLYQAGPSKRRETAFIRTDDTEESTSASSSQSSGSGSQSSQTSVSSASTSKTSVFDVPQSRASRGHTGAPLRIWRSTETDITTPSLCSDNENDHSEDKLPDTPSDSGRGRDDAPSILPKARLPQLEAEIIDVDALDIETPPNREQSESDEEEARPSNDAFASRVPVSPMPSKTPTKPKPPARAAKAKVLAPSKLPLPRRVPIIPLPEDGG